MANFSLFDYQIPAVEKVLASLSAGRHTLLVAPPGAGKTVMAAAVARRFRHPLFVAHRRELVSQMRSATANRVSVCNVRSAGPALSASVDLLGIDEAHRAAAPTYRRIMEGCPRALRFGLTATPVRLDGQGLSEFFDELVECSSMRELIDRGYLVDYEVFEAPDEALRRLARMRRIGGDYDQAELAALMDQPRLVGDVVREYLLRARGQRAIAFAVNVEHSRHLAAAFCAAGVRAAHLDARSPARDREAGLADLARGDLDVLCNVNLFTEGYDCPPISCVIVARPTVSLSLHLQSVGRGLRRFPGKRKLLILDHAGNMQRHGYPDVHRDWSLETERQKARRIAEEERLRRVYALGFSSLEEYQLEQRRLRDISLSPLEVAAMLGVKPDSVPRALRCLGYVAAQTAPKAWHRYERAQVEKALQLRDSSYSAAEARALLGLSERGGAGFLRRNGVVACCGFGKKVRYPKASIDEIIRRRDEGCCVAEIARRAGIKEVSVWPALKKAGISPLAGIPGSGRRGGSVRYDRKQIEAFLAARLDGRSQ